MRLAELYKYLNERFPDLNPEISSKIIDDTEKVQIDFKVVLGVNFDLAEINDETIFNDVAVTVRNGLFHLLLKSQEADEAAKKAAEVPEDIPEQDGASIDESRGIFDDTEIEEVADEDRKVVL